MKDGNSGYVGKKIHMLPRHWIKVDALQKRHGNSGVSAAMRYITDAWENEHDEEPNTIEETLEKALAGEE